MEIVQERLEREYDMDLITTAPTVVYELLLKSGEVEQIENPSRLPEPSRIAEIREPIITINLLMPRVCRPSDDAVQQQARCAAQYAIHGASGDVEL